MKHHGWHLRPPSEDIAAQGVDSEFGSQDNSQPPPSGSAAHVQLGFAMPTHVPSCPRCQDNLFVRLELVLSGRRVSRAYYCGRCVHEWQVETAPPAEAVERRTVPERREPSRVSRRTLASSKS